MNPDITLDIVRPIVDPIRPDRPIYLIRNNVQHISNPNGNSLPVYDITLKALVSSMKAFLAGGILLIALTYIIASKHQQTADMIAIAIQMINIYNIHSSLWLINL